MKNKILGCVPARPADRLGIEFNPPNLSEYQETPCEGCGLSILIGPKGRDLKAAEPALPVLCPICCNLHGGDLNNPQKLT